MVISAAHSIYMEAEKCNFALSALRSMSSAALSMAALLTAQLINMSSLSLSLIHSGWSKLIDLAEVIQCYAKTRFL